LTDPTAYVREVLDTVGVQASELEVGILAATVADMRSRVERLWQIDIGEAPPALGLCADDSLWTNR
jgi:hypothetical protein